MTAPTCSVVRGVPKAIASATAACRTAITITGSIVIEQIYQIPGIGRYFVEGVTNRDYPLVMGVTLFYGSIVIFANLLTDIGRALLDPKVSYE